MNMQNLMAQAQRMQKDITKKQEEIYKKTFVGKSEWIEITMNGKKEIIDLKIKYEGDLNEDKDMLQDMLLLAMKDATSQIEKEVESSLGMYGNMLGGLM